MQLRPNNIFLYRVHALFNEPLLWGAILTTSLQKLAKMSLADIYFMESAVLCICVLCDLPSGAFADVIGRKTTIIIARAFLFMSAVFFTFMHCPLDAWIGNILWAVGFSLQSGADTALLYETLKATGQEQEYKRIEGQATGARLLLIGCCILFAGWLADFNLRLPLYIGLPFVAIPFVSAFFFKEPPRVQVFSIAEHLGVLKSGLQFVSKSVEVRWIIGFVALLATTSKVWFFMYNPYFERVGIPLAYYGVIFACLNVVAWFSSHFAYKLEKILDEKYCVIGMVFLLTVPILLMAWFPSQPIAWVVLVQNVVRGFMRPFAGGFLNRHIDSSIRATVLSTQSSVANLVSIGNLALFGFLMKYLTLLQALGILGCFVLVLGLLSYRAYLLQVHQR